MNMAKKKKLKKKEKNIRRNNGEEENEGMTSIIAFGWNLTGKMKGESFIFKSFSSPQSIEAEMAWGKKVVAWVMIVVAVVIVVVVVVVIVVGVVVAAFASPAARCVRLFWPVIALNLATPATAVFRFQVWHFKVRANSELFLVPFMTPKLKTKCLSVC